MTRAYSGRHFTEPALTRFSVRAMLLSFNHSIYRITAAHIPCSYSGCRLSARRLPSKSHRRRSNLPLASSPSAYASTAGATEEAEFDFSGDEETENYSFSGSFELSDSKRFDSPAVEVKELNELPDQWRRSRIAWLCKELPAHRSGTFIRVLNAQRKWIRQVDCTYIAVHCLRIRENESAFRVYKWMMQQQWFRFDFALATKLADYMGKDRKPLKCREIFDDIVNQGLIPNESTFHILIVAYLSSSSSNYLEEACNIYNQMIHLGCYKPLLSLHNSLFRAIVRNTERRARKRHLEQAEFIFQNLTTCGLRIHNDIYGGLIWLHSYQDVIDKERIKLLRAEMKSLGIKESVEVLVSVLRACAKEGDLAEAEVTWKNIISSSDNKPPIQAFLCLMEVYSRIGKPMKSLEIFRDSQGMLCSTSVAPYYKIIEILCKARETELAESLMEELLNSSLKPVMRSFIDIMDMYADLGMHDKVGSTFLWCMEKCRPNQIAYNLYLDSLVQTDNLDRAEEIFNRMHADEALGVNAKSCNTILRGYLTWDHYAKVKVIYNFMREKRYEIEPSLTEKLEYILKLSQEEVKKKSVTLKLSKEQREILIGLLLGGLRIKPGEANDNHAIHFVFKENFKVHSVLKRHIHNQFHEWLACKLNEDIPHQFTTVSHSYFKFYADNFAPQGTPVIPKLIHRWLTPRVLAHWYMYGGYRTSSGDILLKLRFSKEDVMRIAKAFKAKSLNCRVRKKGTVFWIGLLGRDAVTFWELTEPFVLTELKESLEAGVGSPKERSGAKNVNIGSGLDTDEKGYDCADGEDSNHLISSNCGG